MIQVGESYYADIVPQSFKNTKYLSKKPKTV